MHYDIPLLTNAYDLTLALFVLIFRKNVRIVEKDREVILLSQLIDHSNAAWCATDMEEKSLAFPL
jgi:hypothetical protein